MHSTLNKEEIEEGINNNLSMINEIEMYLADENDTEKKLRNVSLISLLYATCVTGIYSSNRLESLIANIGKAIVCKPYNPPQNNRILHVLTRGASYGGHSVLACNFIKWDTCHESSVVFTDMIKEEIPSIFMDAVSESGGTVYTLDGGYIDKAKKLLELSKNYKAIVLHMHMNDVVPVLAYSNANWNTPVFFCNHADFRFSLGYSVADKVLNITKYDIEKNYRYRGISKEKNEFLFFPNLGDIGSTEIIKDIREKYDIPQNKRLVVSMGADYKFKTVLNWSFIEFVEKLLSQVDDIYYVIIGADPSKDEWISLNTRTNGRARALGILSKNDAESLIAESCLYISSFPMISSGAKTAEKYGIPNLLLLITGRAREYYGTNIANSIEELIEKSVDALENGAERYLGNDKIEDMSKGRWQETWNNVLEETKDHSYYTFEEHRIIETQEYLDYEMMRDDAPSWIGTFLWKEREDSNLYLKICELQNRYKTKLLPDNHLEMMAREAWVFKKLFHRTIKWVETDEKQKCIEKALHKLGCNGFVIYGLGDLGKIMLKDLRKIGCPPDCCVDKNASNIKLDFEVLKPAQFEERYRNEMIINTTVFDDEAIRNEFGLKNISLINIDEILRD